jgi:hypothetical protein
VRDGASASPPGPEVVARLAALVGEGHVVTDPSALAPYARDKSPFPELVPAVVVRPADVAEVAAVVALANELRFALLPRGAGFSIAGYPPATGHRSCSSTRVASTASWTSTRST